MPYDGIFIHFLVDELKQKLVGGKINKVIESGSLDIILQIRAKDIDGKIINQQLLLSTSLDMPRIHLVKQKLESIDVPKNFCMILRKYIERSIVTDICQLDNDRVIIFTFSSTSELGDNKTYKLIVELMGRNSNIILTNYDNTIIDAIRKLPPNDDVTRIILPKATYSFPESTSKINPFFLKEDDEYFESDIQGVAKIVHTSINNLGQNLYKYLRNKTIPTIYKLDKKYDFYILPLDSYEVVKQDFNTISDMLEVFYKEYRTIYTDKAKELKKVVKNKITHLQTKYDNLEKDLDDAKENLKYNNLGILLQTNLYKVKKGMDKITVEDFTDNNSLIEIPLNPMLDPSINLKKIFNKGKKAKNGITMINKQLELTSSEIDYLDVIYHQIDLASSIDLDEIRDELVANKYLKPQKQNKPKNKKINMTKFLLNGNEILVGKNNVQNDYITHKLSKSYDWWFHVKDIPGSHVLFKMPSPDYKLTEEDIRYCANLAASFSRARTSSSVPVDYLQVKFIKKIPGVKGSEVTYSNQKTIYIDPNL